MADKTIGDLTQATYLDDESLLVVEQHGEARSVSGKVVKGLVEPYANAAQSAYEGVKEALDNIPAGATVIVNDLTTGGTTAALSAEQGKVLGAHISDKNNPHGVTAAQVGAVALSGTVITSDVDLLTLEKGVFCYEGTVPSGKNYPVALEGTYQRCNISVTFPAGTITAGYREVTLRTSYGRIFCNSQQYSSWAGWRELATTGYAVNKAGDTMANTLTVKKAGGAYVVVRNDDSTARGVLGKLGTSGTQLIDYDASGNMGVVAVKSNTALEFVTQAAGGAQIINKILHTGNKPSGSYTGNGDATKRTIETGGIGSVIAIYSNLGKAFVCWAGGICASGTTVSNHTTTEVQFSSGVLTIASTNQSLNQSGVTYTYQVL